MILALVGNQNCGKTTLFNAITGSNQHVGNFPGVTVEQKIGVVKGHPNCSVVDLPGIYSLRPYSQEERVTRDFILNEKPDGVINIVDATNIERNLYLTLQLLELHIPTVIALNMMDELRGNGGSVNISAMSHALGVPVVPISAIKNEGVADLMDTADDISRRRERPRVTDFCPYGAVHRCVHSVMMLTEHRALAADLPPRFCATWLIEGGDMADKLSLSANERQLIELSVTEMEREIGLNRNAALADMRYNFIEQLCRDTVVKCTESRERHRSVKIDSVLTNKYLAMPIFICIMMLIFYLTFSVIGSALSKLLGAAIAQLASFCDRLMTDSGVNSVIHSLVIDGIFAGVGSVLSFLPIIMVLFFFLSILEDTGYMARIAFVMDKPLRKIGLSGSSFVPMLIGLGCSVPAVMATRTLSGSRERKLTVMLIPYISCSAKIPIYTVFCAAFFGRYQVAVMALLYVGGILLGVMTASLLSKTVFSGRPVPFMMELPNYRLPSARSVVMLMREKARDFLQRAFTVIFMAAVIIWFLRSFDIHLNVVTDSRDSILALIGRAVAPIFAPLGFGDWRVATSLISGFTAKEAVISTLSVLTGVSIDQLPTGLSALFTPQSAAAFLAFTLLYTPCVAAVATIRRELNSTQKTVGIVIMQCAVAWLVSFAVYRVGALIL